MPELLADEWVLVPAFWQRWYYAEDGREPSHRVFNEQPDQTQRVELEA